MDLLIVRRTSRKEGGPRKGTASANNAMQIVRLIGMVVEKGQPICSRSSGGRESRVGGGMGDK